MEIGELQMAQADGGPPTIVVSGSAPGESGVAVLRARFRGGVHFSGTLRPHQVCFQLSPPLRMERRMGGRALRADSPPGTLSICPGGADCAGDGDASFDGVLVAIDPARWALAAAEDGALGAQLIGRLADFDLKLFDLGRRLAAESEADYPNGALFWNAMADDFVGAVVARHTSQPKRPRGGRLGRDVLQRLRDHVLANLDEPIGVGTLANIAGRSPFHFTRVFAQSVGMTPHRYVVHLRLQRAIELVREGRLSLAEIAASTGFSDQSHLSRWVRRVYGVSLTEFAS
jgi:AraC family transcriptional regulator